MENKLLLGLWRCMLPVPPAIWQGQVTKGAEKTDSRLDFMSEDHHRVRDMAVLELSRTGKPLPAERFARELDLPLDRVQHILDELERNMTFLFRNQEGAVTWAYPVTVDRTPHHVIFSTGEEAFAA